MRRVIAGIQISEAESTFDMAIILVGNPGESRNISE